VLKGSQYFEGTCIKGFCCATEFLIHEWSGFDSQCYQIFWEVVGLERGPLSLVSTIEELLGRKSSGSGLESREYGCRDPSCWTHGTLYLQKLALTMPTSGGHLVDVVRSQTQTMGFSFLYLQGKSSYAGKWNLGSKDEPSWKFTVPVRTFYRRLKSLEMNGTWLRVLYAVRKECYVRTGIHREVSERCSL
jgi:hypothetical protein